MVVQVRDTDMRSVRGRNLGNMGCRKLVTGLWSCGEGNCVSAVVEGTGMELFPILLNGGCPDTFCLNSFSVLSPCRSDFLLLPFLMSS